MLFGRGKVEEQACSYSLSSYCLVAGRIAYLLLIGGHPSFLATPLFRRGCAFLPNVGLAEPPGLPCKTRSNYRILHHECHQTNPGIPLFARASLPHLRLGGLYYLGAVYSQGSSGDNHARISPSRPYHQSYSRFIMSYCCRRKSC